MENSKNKRSLENMKLVAVTEVLYLVCFETFDLAMNKKRYALTRIEINLN